MRARIIVLTITLFFMLSAGSAGGARYEPKSNVSATRDIDYDGWDSYKLHASGKKVDISVTIVEGTSVDFYIFTESEYDEYTDPSAMQMGYETKSEVVKSFNYSGSNIEYLLVIDNADISTTGAMSTGNVTYDIDIKYTEMSLAENLMALLCSGFGLCGVVILLVAATSFWLYTVPKQYKERAQKLKEFSK